MHERGGWVKVVLIIVSLLLAVSVFPSFVSAASWYVDNARSSGGNGQSWGGAWKSFSSISWGSINPGDTLYISGGSSGKTYSEGLTVGANGAAGAPITITGGKDSGHNGLVTFKNNGITVDTRRYITISKMKFGADSQVYITGTQGFFYEEATASKFIVVDDNEFYVTIHGGVFVQTSDNVIIRNSRMTTPTRDSSQTDGIYSQRNKNNIYENNHIVIYNQDTGGHDDAIQMYQDDSTIIRGNYLAQVNEKSGNAQGLYATTMYGTTVYYNNVINLGNTQSNALSFKRNSGGGGTGTIIMIGNTVYAKRPHHALWVHDTPNPVVKNNIVYTLSGAGLSLSGSSAEVSNNLVNTDPKFVSISNNDFRLQSGSPAIGGGVNLGSPYNIDKDGNSRGSSWDIGAYEYGGNPPQSCSQLGGTGCQQGQTCDGGNFLFSSDFGSLCCVGGSCLSSSQSCSDGTSYGSCSSIKPRYCLGGNLVDDCQSCGCSSGGSCNADGSCGLGGVPSPDTDGDGCVSFVELFDYIGLWKAGQSGISLSDLIAAIVWWKQGCGQTCSDGTVFGQCSGNKPLFCQNGNLVNSCQSCGCSSGSCQSDGSCSGGSGGFLPNTVVEAEAGSLVAPMSMGSVSGVTYVSTSGVDQGSVSFTFDVSQAGDYFFEASVQAGTPGTDSFFVGLSSENAQGNTQLIWDVVNNAGFIQDVVSHRGSGGSPTSADFDPKTWSLTSGSHTFVFFGREANTRLNNIVLRLYVPPQCGDGSCGFGESCSSCPSDCGACPPVCGDGSVDPGEQCDDGSNNGNVCSPSYQGSCSYCSNSCVTTIVQGGFCGDSICNGPETEASCPNDCTGVSGDGYLPASRSIDWSNVGIPGGIPHYPVSTALSAGATGSQIQNALNNAPPNTAVKLGPGDFNLGSTTVSIPSRVALRGSGVEQTRILCARPGSRGRCFTIGDGSSAGSGAQITGGLQRGSTQVTVSSTSGMNTGGIMEIVQDNDRAFFSCGYQGCEDQNTWGARSMGQTDGQEEQDSPKPQEP